MTKGIHNPWSKPVIEKAEDQKVVAPDSKIDEAPPLPVRFPGQTYILQVGIILPKKVKISPQKEEEFGRIVLGAALKELFTKIPKAIACFQEQAIDLKPLLGPKVTMVLGGLTLYAKASSMDVHLAILMTLDRIVLALMTVQSTFPTSHAILNDYHVKTVLRA